MDSLLEPFLAASGEDAEKLLEDLLVEAEPRIRKVILRKLGPECQDLDDVCADVLVEATEQLRAWKAAGAGGRVDSFANYVAVCSFNAASEYLRRKYPRWRRMRDRIHYLLRHDPRCAIWQSPGGWLCGWAALKGQDFSVPLPVIQACDGARNLRPADSLYAVLGIAAGPVDLDALVELAASLWGKALDRQSPQFIELAAAPGFDEEIDQRRYAERLWRQILELPERQRQALLMNMNTDGLDIFLLFGVASFHALAGALALDGPEFASLWRRLPLDDLTIAGQLGLTRQQVINLRKSARKRLSNRMQANKEFHFTSSRKDTVWNI
jgi:RNA polymerase sigma factor (sigma-70 family)